MKIMVTGGAGFIGHNVVNKLEKIGHECLVLDNFTDYGIIPPKELDSLHGERKKYYKAPIHYVDIRNFIDVEWAIIEFQPEIIIHLAGFPRQKFINLCPKLAADTMIGGLVGLLECAKKYGVRRFVYVSSSMVYGDFMEPVREFSPTNPVGQYGIFKLAGEMLTRDYAYRTAMEYIIIRPSSVYGPRDIKDRVINKFFIAAMKGKPLQVEGINETLDMTYIDDAVMGIVEASLNLKHFNTVYNITRSVSHTLKEAAELIIQIVGNGAIEIKAKDKDMPSRGRLSIDKAQWELGYTPKIDIEEGFQKCYEWIKNTVY